MADVALYEEYLDLPLDAPANLHGFALDIGCLLAKLAINQGCGPRRMKLCLRTYPVERLEDLFVYAKSRLPTEGTAAQNISVALSAEEPDSIVEKIKQTFGESVNVTVYDRNDSIIKGFHAMTSLPESQIAHELTNQQKIFMKNMEPTTQTVPHQLSDRPIIQFPCLFANLGSRFRWFRVEADGSYKVIQTNPRGGLYYLSLAKLLFGCKSYEELVTLAAKGNGGRLSFCVTDFLPEKFGPFDAGLMIRMMPDYPVTMFPFWKIIHNNVTDPQPEEIAHVLVEMGSGDFLNCAGHFHATSEFQCEQVYVSGNFLRGQTVTSKRLQEVAPLQNFMFMKPMFKPTLLKHEGYLGAIGAMVRLIKS